MKSSSRLGLKMTARLAVSKSRITSKIITVILSAFSFAIFGFVSMGFTYDLHDYVVRGYQYYLENERQYYAFTHQTWDDYNHLTHEKIVEVKERMGMGFVSLFYVMADEMDNFVTNRNNENVRYYLGEFGAVAGKESEFEKFGFEIAEGRYPQKVNEIAISEVQFEAFKLGGYSDNRENYRYSKDGKWEDGLNSYHSDDGYYYDRMKEGPCADIERYSDIIGKKIVLCGNPETGEMSREHIFEAEIVGVIQTGQTLGRSEWGESYEKPMSGKIFLSPEWENRFSSVTPSSLIAPALDTSYKTVEKGIAITEEWMREYAEELVERGIKDEFQLSDFSGVGLSKISRLFESSEKLSSGHNVKEFFLALGAFFGGFAVLLNGYLVTNSVERKQRQIGILRSLGASYKVVIRIVLLEVLFLSVGIFAASLAFTWIPYAIIMPSMIEAFAEFNVLPYQFNGWTVLIEAGISFLVPMICAMFPLARFSRRTIVDNISGNFGKRTKRSRREKS